MNKFTNRTSTSILLLLTSSFVQAQTAKTSFADLYARMKSSDPIVRSQAQTEAPMVLEDNLPSIEGQSAVIAAGLHDSDPYIRLQSSAILALVSKTIPGHSALLRTCLPDLQMAVADDEPRVRINALLAIAYLDGGTPVSATPALLKALGMPDADTKAFSALALLKLNDLPDAVSQQIANSVHQASDSLTKNQMIRAIFTAGPVPTSVADSVVRLTTDSDPDIKLLAIQTVPRMYSDKAVAESKLLEVVRSSTIPSAATNEAHRQIELLNAGIK